MRYYSENNRPQLLWASLSAAVYVVILLLLFFFIRFDIQSAERTAVEIAVEFIEPEPEPVQPPRQEVAEPQIHDKVATVDNEQQVTGTDTKTQTVNPRAMFRINKGGSDEPENAGNPKAREGENDAANGDGGGLNPIGTDQLDAGLQGRGLVGALPKPQYKGNSAGKVVIKVVINQYGQVTNAVFQPVGSTTNDSALIDEAIAAARKARFTESRALTEGGTITYYFNLK